MHLQVYLHKTVTAAEAMLGALLRRAGDLLREGSDAMSDCSPALALALGSREEMDVATYLELDDVEVWGHIKRWSRSADGVLSDLSRRLLTRQISKTIEIAPTRPDLDARFEEAGAIIASIGLDPDYYLLKVESSDTPYGPYDPSSERSVDHILIQNEEGKLVDVAEVSPTIKAFTESGYTLTRVIYPARGEGFEIRSRIEELLTRP